MAEFTRFEIYLLLNQQKPLWLNEINLSAANLSGATMPDGNEVLIYDNQIGASDPINAIQGGSIVIHK